MSYRSANSRRLLALPLVVFATACGSSHSPQAVSTTTPAAATGPTVALAPADAAVVGGEHVTKQEIAAMMNELIVAARKEHQPVPKQGTPAYRALQDEAVNYFVSSFALEQRARRDFGVAISPQDVDASLAHLRDHNFGGSEAKMVRHFQQAGISQAQLRIFQRIQLAETELPKKLAAHDHVKVSVAEARAYYKTHLRTYTAFAPTRPIRDLKVGSEQLAQSLYRRIQHGASLAALAARYSTESGVLKAGRSYELTEGSIDKPLSDAAFGLATGAVSRPIQSGGSWYLIQPVAASQVGTKPFGKVEHSIEQMLIASKTTNLVKAWIANLAHTACDEIRYRAGYQPSNTVCGSA